jgi:hypothetical protein
VLVVGGAGSRSAELYDPTTNTWSPVASLGNAVSYHSATLLPNGQVLVAGGASSSGTLSTAELFGPVSDTWSSTGSLAIPRQQHTATLLPSGQVLVAGGYGTGGPLTSAELYTPAPAAAAPALPTWAALLAFALLALAGCGLRRRGPTWRPTT